MRTRSQAALGAFLILVACVGPSLAEARQYPTRPVRILVPVPPGGAADFTARLVGDHLGELLKQAVVIENRPGASGIIAADVVAKATPDGYTLLENTITTHGIGPNLFRKLPYNPTKDFTPIIQLNTIPLIMVVSRSVPATSVAQLIALAKAKPGALKFASAGTGSAPHLTGVLFEQATGVKLTHVPYRGSGPAVVDLVAGRVQIMFDGAPSLLPYIKSGQLRPLAAASAKRNPLLPDVPTFAELGYKGVEAGLWYGLLAPAHSPKQIVRLLNADVNRILKMPDVRRRFAEQGAEAVGGTPAQFAEFMRREQMRWGAVIKRIGLKRE